MYKSSAFKRVDKKNEFFLKFFVTFHSFVRLISKIGLIVNIYYVKQSTLFNKIN